ncbi:linoleate diol synthase precursor [Biscogniauxia marginata]|nr:linoleate diol synthase precursor [Biscogniauxia marginata]
MTPNLAQAIKMANKAISPTSKYQFTPRSDDNSEYSGILQDLENLGIEDYKTLISIVKSTAAGEIDDDELLLERIVTLLAKLPPHSREGKNLTDTFINTLWYSLEHPPPQIRTKDHRYRAADGSHNNFRTPMMGAANTPYARTTPATILQGPNFPDPELIFDSLMARGDGGSFREHPNRISSMLFYLAIIITHDIFQSDPRNRDINLTSSYLDLSPLYGRNLEEQKAVRTLKNGLLKPDCFSSKALLGFPPGVGVFLIMFNRFHNYVVTQLARINERGRFSKPETVPNDSNTDAWAEYDNELFQTGRLITCGLYVNIILKDYVRTILNVNRSGSTWVLDPRTQEKKGVFNSTPAPMATGNQVSVEFNLVYRWHSATSKRDEDWTNEQFRQALGGADPAKASIGEIMQALARFERAIPNAPEERNLDGLQRGNNNTYSDDDLVDVLTASIEDVAGAFGANQVPNALRMVEVLGITQARAWRAATLNEFRQYFGLKKHETFEDINPDPVVASKLMALYDSPDAVELYPGLVAEKPKPPMPGSGLCVNFTTSQAILSDAVALVRGDRFYTTDYTPTNLTNWGYNEANFDLEVDQGQVMHKLILRAFPNSFASNSIYAHFPFVVPAENKLILDALKTSEKYTWESPRRKLDTVIIKSYDAVSQILGNDTDFYVPWGEAVYDLATSPGKVFARDFWSSANGSNIHKSRSRGDRCICQPKEWGEEVKSFFEATSTLLLKNACRELPRSPHEDPGAATAWEIDIVRDVVVPLTTRFVTDFFGLPIETTQNSQHGLYTEHGLYELLVATFTVVFFDSDAANSSKLQSQARELALGLEQLLRLETKTNAKAGWFSNVVARFRRDLGGKDAQQRWPSLPHHGRHLLSRMMEEGKTIEECVTNIVMPISAASTTIMSGLLSQCIDYFLGAGSEYLPELYRLAHEDTARADDQLLHYMLEGIRLSGTVVVSRHVVPTSSAQTIADDAPCIYNPSDDTASVPLPNPDRTPSARTYNLVPGQRAILNIVSASYDAKAFPSPETLRLDRPLSSYLPWGLGPQECLGEDITRAALASAFKVIFKLPGLKRAPGPRGECKSMEFKEWRGQVGRKAVEGGEDWTGLRVYMTADQSSYSAIPTTMRVRWHYQTAKGSTVKGERVEDPNRR